DAPGRRAFRRQYTLSAGQLLEVPVVLEIAAAPPVGTPQRERGPDVRPGPSAGGFVLPGLGAALGLGSVPFWVRRGGRLSAGPAGRRGARTWGRGVGGSTAANSTRRSAPRRSASGARCWRAASCGSRRAHAARRRAWGCRRWRCRVAGCSPRGGGSNEDTAT